MQLICANCGADTPDRQSCSVCDEPPLLQARYALSAVLGEGASGTTYRGRDTHSGREVAIKELAFHRVDTFKAHELFEREAAVLCRLDHPGVPQFFDSFAAGEGKALRFYLVMEFIDGHTLEEELAGRQFGYDEVLAILEELGRVTGYLHSLSPPVIHRDIKPSNIMRRPDGTLVLVDFGSVRDALEPDQAGSTIAGTIGYMAPEQLRGVASPASDVYGLACCALHLLTRMPPVDLLDANNALAWQGRVDLPPAVADLLREMLSGDPGQRPSNGRAVARRAHQVRREPDKQTTSASASGSASGSPAKLIVVASSVVGLFFIMGGAGLTLFFTTPDHDADQTREVKVTEPQPLPADDEPAEEVQARTDSSDAEGPPERLTRKQVKHTVTAATERLRTECGPLHTGDEPRKTMVQFQITPAGRVAWAKSTGDGPSTPHTDCVLEIVEDLHFPEAHTSLTVNFPVIYNR
ncbi:MAG: serine/threonine protein kinase [Myxococcota bacterium]